MPAFVSTKYESDSGLIHPLRLTPEYAAVAGTEPTAAANSDISAQISKNGRAYGIKPRGVTCARTIGTAPDTFVKYTFVPLRSIDNYNSPTYAKGETITIDSVVWTIVSKIPENVK